MGRPLISVEETFLIRGRGLVLAPGIAPQTEERFAVGDPIMIKRPDGSHLCWTIGGIDMISGTRLRPNDVVILLKGLGKEDVPTGSEVWSTKT